MAAIALKRGGSFSSASGSSDYGGSTGWLGGGGPPTATGLLASLEYQQHRLTIPQRRHSLARNQSTSTMGDADDLSLKGECDNTSIRSDANRPGRRASLSAAIELTRSPPPKQRGAPKRTTSGTRTFGVRRNSLFGNNGGKDKDAAAESLAKLINKKSSRRASMAGYPATTGATAEPETTPQFFHKHKRDKTSRHPPNRKESRSFDKNDPRAKQIRQKIKRPGKGGSRRASMSALLTNNKSQSKSSNVSKGSQRSLASSNSGGSSSYDVSDDEEYYGFKTGNATPSFRRTVTAPAPQRTVSYGSIKKDAKKQQQKDALDLGYGGEAGYDPQLPPPPAAGSGKSKSSSRKSQFKNRRGSTGTGMSTFSSNTAAQRSLKESLQWKSSSGGGGLRASFKSNRRSSAASSVANSVATDVINNTSTEGARTICRAPADVPPSRSPRDIPPPPSRKTPSDIIPPPSRNGPSDVPPSRAPADIPPTTTTQQQRRVPADLPPPGRGPATPVQADKPRMTLLDDNNNAPGTPLGSANSDHSSEFHQSPIPSKNSPLLNDSSKNSSLMGNHSSVLGGLMSDDSESSHGDGSTGSPSDSLNMLGTRRANRGLSVLQAPAPPLSGTRGQASSMLAGHGSSLGGGFNPYGSCRIRDSDEEEDDADEEEETEEDRAQNKKMADFGSEAGDIPTVDCITDATPTMTLTEPSSTSADETEDKKEDTNKKDDDSLDSMTSEAPEKAPGAVDVDEFAQKQAGTMEDKMEEIGATGDWSGGVSQEALRHQQITNNLLDQYPGSDNGYDGPDLGYGYSHLGQQQQVLHAYDNEIERKDGDPDYDDSGWGPSDLYDEDYSSFGWREHRPRAAESIEFINMEQLMSKAKNTKGLYLPNFTPAHGCTNASDFIVRCFVARLRAGLTVTKHSRSRFCKSHDRIIHILPTGYHITWIPDLEEEPVEKSKKKPPTKLDLTKCVEVRHAWSRDPKSIKYTGTATLRAKCKEGAANRSFALIYPHRTVDFTAATVDQCKILMEGFSALCFRLQMARLEQQAGDDDTQNTGFTGTEHDNDSTTASLTGTNMSAPWGL